jgi:hypothetical protein
MSPRWQTRLPTIVGAISLLVWILANSVLWYHFAGTRPRQPNPATGNVYALNTHGSVAYLTIIDCIVLYGTSAVAWIGGLSVIFMAGRQNGWTLPKRTDK